MPAPGARVGREALPAGSLAGSVGRTCLEVGRLRSRVEIVFTANRFCNSPMALQSLHGSRSGEDGVHVVDLVLTLPSTPATPAGLRRVPGFRVA